MLRRNKSKILNLKSDAPTDARSDARSSLTLRYRYRFSTRRCANANANAALSAAQYPDFVLLRSRSVSQRRQWFLSIPSPLALASPFGRRGDAARTAWCSRSWGATAVDGLRGIKEAVRPSGFPTCSRLAHRAASPKSKIQNPKSKIG